MPSRPAPKAPENASRNDEAKLRFVKRRTGESHVGDQGSETGVWLRLSLHLQLNCAVRKPAKRTFGSTEFCA